MFIDISVPIHEGIAVWPGDTPFKRTVTPWGDVQVGAVNMSLHMGTHVDAPRHFLPDGAAVDTLDLSDFMGLAVVIDAVGRVVLHEDLFIGVAAPRVLVRTDAWIDHSRFPMNFPLLTPAAVEALKEAGVVLLGIDVPSVDAVESKTLPNHHALAAAGIQIVESLDLRDAPAGVYELFAAPLMLFEADASPVRAVLRKLS